ncbi:MAG TPA: hypothetical protein VGL40_02185 [Bacillota bacterium]
MIVVTPEGRETEVLDEIGPSPGKNDAVIAAADAEPQSIMLAFDPAPPTDNPVENTRYSNVNWYYLGGDGRWIKKSLRNLVAPALRQGSVTFVAVVDGIPWVEELTPSGETSRLFEVPVSARLAGVGSAWDSSGQTLFFRDGGVYVHQEVAHKPRMPAAPGKTTLP